MAEKVESRRLMSLLFGSQVHATPLSFTSVAGGDFNEDGNQDVFCIGTANAGGLYLGSQSLQFTPFATGLPAATNASAGDLDLDGHLDLVLCDGGAGVASIYRGDGHGGFAFQQQLVARQGSNEIALADLNLDGKPDIVVTNSLSNTMSLFRSQPGGGYGAAQNVPTSTLPIALVAADFNLDGKPDIAVASASTGLVNVFMGNGTGGFASRANYDVAPSLSDLSVGDFNRDGRPDLAVAHRAAPPRAGGVAILLNGASGFSPAVDVYTSDDPENVAATDVNQDHWVDLVVSSQADGAADLAVLLGKPDATFDSARTTRACRTAADLWVADLNQDGITEAVCVSAIEQQFTVSPVLGDTAHGTLSTDSPVDSFVVEAADLNQDGIKDLLLGDDTNGKALAIRIGNGDGTYGPPVEYALPNTPTKVISADLNRDGALDIAAILNISSGQEPSRYAVLLNLGDGTFGPASVGTLPGFLMGMTAADLNGDGAPELIIVAQGRDLNAGSIQIYPNAGNGTFLTPFALEPNGDFLRVAGADLDLDGRTDLVITRSGGPAYLFWGNGNLTFSRQTLAFTSYVCAIANLDGNNLPDIVFGADYSVVTLRNLGSRTFTTHGNTTPNKSQHMLIADFNGDSLDDVATSSAGVYSFDLLINAGNANFIVSTHGRFSIYATFGSAFDYDNDGDVDLIISAAHSIEMVSNRRIAADRVSLAGASLDIDRRTVVFDFTLPLRAWSIQLADLQVTNLANPSLALSATSFQVLGDGKRVEFLLDTLPDGDYRFSIAPASLVSLSGFTNPETLQYSGPDAFFLTGDVNHDRTVNFDDLLIVVQNYEQSGRTYSQGNVDYSADGVIGFDDLLLLAQHYGASVVRTSPASRRLPLALDVVR